MKNIRIFSENFHFLVVKFSVYLNRRVFEMLFRRVLCVYEYNIIKLVMNICMWRKNIV